jgi:hypothetical protein
MGAPGHLSSTGQIEYQKKANEYNTLNKEPMLPQHYKKWGEGSKRGESSSI